MCGIVGFVGRNHRHGDQGLLRAMTRTLRHRGPDGEGFHCADGAFLGHTRLAVIDPAGGKQPMTSEDGSVVMVMNGEIYNHSELEEELRARGHAFRSRCDAEVLVHLYEEEGPDLFQHIRGMFAVALWDSRKRRLLLARDAMGKKPLYYAVVGDEVVFASELTPIVRHPRVRFQVDRKALLSFLVLDYVPTPRSILSGVRKLEPGTCAVFSDRAEKLQVYRFFALPKVRPLAVQTTREAARHFLPILQECVASRLEADVPLGVFLSGGLDSAALLAALSRLKDPGTVTTISVAFDEPSFDESYWARMLAEHFGTRHIVEKVTAKDALDLFPRLPFLCDEPLGDYSLVPTHLLCARARQHITVALSGDGGDELFLGYPTFFAHGLGVLAHRLGLFRLAGLASLLPASDADWSLEYRLKRFLRGVRYGPFEQHSGWIGGFTPEGAWRVLAPKLRQGLAPEQAFERVGQVGQEFRGWPLAQALSCVYASLYLRDGVLTKVDRASMAVGLEVRSPFLDTRMVRFALSVSYPCLHPLRTTKTVVRTALRGMVPEPILKRPKKGFGVPLSRWFRNELRDILLSHLSPDAVRRHGFFDPLEVKRLLDLHLSGRQNLRKELFNILVFQMWFSAHAP